MLLGVAAARVRLLVEQLVGVGTADAVAEVLEERPHEVDGRGRLGDGRLVARRPGARVVEAGLGRPHGLAARDPARAPARPAGARGRATGRPCRGGCCRRPASARWSPTRVRSVGRREGRAQDRQRAQRRVALRPRYSSRGSRAAALGQRRPPTKWSNSLGASSASAAWRRRPPTTARTRRACRSRSPGLRPKEAHAARGGELDGAVVALVPVAPLRRGCRRRRRAGAGRRARRGGRRRAASRRRRCRSRRCA